MNYYLLAYITPASGWCIHTIIIHNELDRDLIREDQSKVPCLVLLRMDLGGDVYLVMILEPVSLESC